MRRRLLSSFALVCGLLFLFVNTAEAQRALRAEKTVFVKPRIGLANYHGDLTENFTFAFDKGIPYSAGLELGYQFSSAFSVSVQTNFAEYSSLDPHFPNGDTDRWTHNLLLRYTAGARTSPVAFFLQAGAHGTDGVGDFAFGPSVGLGLDIALSDRVYLFLEALTNFTFPDERFDADESESPSFDLVGYVGPGLKINFARAFTPVQVLGLECPDELEVGETATFTATTNSDVATQPISYSWNFGDGTTATGAIATRSFNQAGTYTVTFTARNNGDPASQSCVVQVVEPPVPATIVSINASETRFQLCEPVTVDFTANVQGDEPITFAWNFGDGTTGTGREASHTYSEPGTYTVTLTASNQHGESTQSITITAEPCTAGICYEITEMNSVFFGRNSSTLTDEGRAALDENVEIFEECPNLCAQIVGFAAPGERNAQDLSQARAQAVEEYYVSNGIPASRFVTEGRGVVGGMTTKKEGTSQLRRVDTIPVQCVDLD